MVEYFRIHIGYEQVFGRKLPLTDAIAHLKGYSLRRLIQVLSGVDACLSFVSQDEYIKAHQFFIREFLTQSQKSDVARVVKKYKEKRAQPSLILFHELQILNAIKLALIHCDDEVVGEPDNLEPLIKALLIINDHLLLPQVSSERFDRLNADDQRRYLVQYIVPNAVFNQGTNILNYLTRWHDLFFVDAPSLYQRKDDIDLSANLANLIGLDTKLFYWLGNALFTHWMKSVDQVLNQGISPLNMQTWFKDFDIGPADYEPVLSEFSSNRAEIRSRFEEKQIWEPYYFLPMQSKPLLKMGSLIFCLSRRFTADKISLGLYHLLLTKLRTSDERGRYLSFFGYVFEAYVNRLFNRGSSPSRVGKFSMSLNRQPRASEDIQTQVLLIA